MVDRERFREGDHQYFEEIIRDHQRAVKAVCLSYGESDDDVKDLLQEVWALAYKKRRSFRDDGSLGGWLCRLATNHCTDDYRARRAERKGLEGFKAREGLRDLHRRPRDPGEELDQKEAERTLWKALDALPDKEREAIVLRLIEGRPPKEVADEMKIGKASVRSNISRGIRRLRGIIGGGAEK